MKWKMKKNGERGLNLLKKPSYAIWTFPYGVKNYTGKLRKANAVSL